MNRLFIIDGHALMFRMYYAFLRRPMINTAGTDTSVIFGFTKYLLELIQKQHPTHLAVAFDPPAKTFRHEAYEPYKANRSATPEVIKDSLQPLVDIVKSLNIPVLMVPGFEADDVIGTLASQCGSPDMTVYMVSPDKDMGQLISDHILQLKPGKAGADDEVLTREGICEKFGISSPKQVIDILAIWGDSSDNVPGVRGIGEVGAKKLVGTYGSVENIMEHADELSAKQAEAVREASQTLPLSKYLVTIRTDVPVEYTQDDLKLSIDNIATAKELLRKYECFSVAKTLDSIAGTAGIASQSTDSGSEDPEDMPADLFASAPEQQRTRFTMPYIAASYAEFEAAAASYGTAGIIVRLSADKHSISDITLSTEKSDRSSLVYRTENPEELRPLLENGSITKTGYELKQAINALRRYGIRLSGHLADIELMHYLINPEISHRFDILTLSYLRMQMEEVYAEHISTDANEESSSAPDLFSAPEEASSEDAGTKQIIDCSLLIPLYNGILSEFKADTKLGELYDIIEMPLMKVLADMEATGVRIDTAMLSEYGVQLRAEMEKIEARIREATDSPTLNVSSPMQLGIVLFEKMKLDPKAKANGRGRYTTDEETLSALADKHPVINDILQFRAVKKLISTYIEPFPTLIDPRDGMLHTTFNQALTATGRLSSVHPNLQNIPIRTDMGREIRKAFVPSAPDHVIVSADYSQIELRIIAALSGDEHMIGAFREGRDIHTSTAAKIYGIPEDEVTSDQRRTAKTTNFGIIYGISAFGLAQRLGVTRTEAKNLIEGYFQNFPTITAYIGQMKEKARKDGYVQTIFGRRRYLKDINSRNATVRAFAERNAVNAPIQGSAADIIKIAMNSVAAELATRGLRTKMILQVHDELVFDTPADELDTVMQMVREKMEGVADIGVPLTVECNYGKNWLEAH